MTTRLKEALKAWLLVTDTRPHGDGLMTNEGMELFHAIDAEPDDKFSPYMPIPPHVGRAFIDTIGTDDSCKVSTEVVMTSGPLKYGQFNSCAESVAHAMLVKIAAEEKAKK